MRLKLITISISVILAGFFATNIAQAQAVPFFGEAKDICELIRNIFYFGVSLAGIAAMLVIMIGGIIYMVSFGSEEKKKMAMDLMGGALKGLLLALFTWTIFYIINPYLLKCKVPTLEVELPDLCEDYPDKIYQDKLTCRQNCPSASGFCYPAKEAEKYCCVPTVTPSCTGATAFNDEDECERKGDCPDEACWQDPDMWGPNWCCISVAPVTAVDSCWDFNQSKIVANLDEDTCRNTCYSPKHCQQTKDPNISPSLNWCCTNNYCQGIVEDPTKKMACISEKIKDTTGCGSRGIDLIYPSLKTASDPLLNLIDCTVDKLHAYKAAKLPVNDYEDFRITSIMDCCRQRNTLGQCDPTPQPPNPDCTIGNHGDPCGRGYSCSECVHRRYSYHYGGRNCDGSYAVDWSSKGNSDTVTQAAEACGAYVLVHEGKNAHLHLSIGQQNGCGTSKY